MKIYPAYDSIVAYLETSAKELDWTMNCPAMIKADAVSLAMAPLDYI